MLMKMFNSISEFLSAMSRRLIRLYLITLILASLALAISIFTATQFQVRVANYNYGGVTLSVWKVNKLVEQWRGRRDLAATQLKDSREAEEATSKSFDAAIVRLIEIQAVVVERAAGYEKARREAVEAIRSVNPSLSDKLAAATPEEVAAIIAASRQRGPVREALQKLDDARKSHAEARAEEEKAKADKDGAGKGLESLEKKRETAQNIVLQPLREGDPKEAAQVEIAAYEFDEMTQSRWGKWIHGLALFPTDFLTLVLVVVMGLLGSSLQLSYIYTTQGEQRTMSFYLTRPFLGVITAFVVYIVVKASIPLVADPSRLGGSVPVNPYFISFVAIISGLLSERAIMSLINIGSKYFTVDPTGQPNRWPVTDLKARFTQANRDTKAIGRILNIRDPDQVEKWMSGEEATPYSAQTLVAAILDQPLRELFTDIPPEAAPAAAQVAGSTAEGHD